MGMNDKKLVAPAFTAPCLNINTCFRCVHSRRVERENKCCNSASPALSLPIQRALINAPLWPCLSPALFRFTLTTPRSFLTLFFSQVRANGPGPNHKGHEQSTRDASRLLLVLSGNGETLYTVLHENRHLTSIRQIQIIPLHRWKYGKQKKRKNVSSFWCFVLSGGLLLLRLLLSQWLRQQFLELLILELLLDLDELGLVPQWWGSE